MLPSWCDDSNPPCCRTLWDTADALLTVAYEAVKGCCSGGECDELVSFISVGAPTYALGDYVCVWLDTVQPGYRPPREREQNMIMPRTVGRYGVQLMESGWPNVEGGPEGTVPSPEAISAAAIYSYAHFESMTRAIYRYVMRDLHCSSYEIEAAVPNSGEMYAGWQMFVQISWDM